MNGKEWELGIDAEDAVARYLARQGCEILARNWACAAGEADIVAVDGGVLVFCQVRAREGIVGGIPADVVGDAERARWEAVALSWLAENDAADAALRFDIATVVAIGRDRAVVRYHSNVLSCAEPALAGLGEGGFEERLLRAAEAMGLLSDKLAKLGREADGDGASVCSEAAEALSRWAGRLAAPCPRREAGAV